MNAQPGQILPAGTRTPFERIALLLQGGGALGAYQAGVYQALDEAGLPQLGRRNLYRGNEFRDYRRQSARAARRPPARVLGAVSASPLGLPNFTVLDPKNQFGRQFINQAQAMNILLFGAPNFFATGTAASLWPPSVR